MAWMHLKTLSRDHPRIRGEHCCDQWIITCSGGSSPHTRGALTHRRQDVALDGIIPAYAGSTPEKVVPAAASRDHPRIRGEHGLMQKRHSLIAGSSPHTRGAQIKHDATLGDYGIIPAYAGSTTRGHAAKTATGDHPRIRGEHYSSARPRACSSGSSPHTRGAPGQVEQVELDPGIIPAYAGSTYSSHAAANVTRDHPRIRGEHCPPW